MSDFAVFLLTGLLLVALASVLFAALTRRSARRHLWGAAEPLQSGSDRESVSDADALPQSGRCSACDELGAFYAYQMAANRQTGQP